VITLRHALRNAIIPVVTVVGLQMGALLSGAIVVETVFAWPGIGRLVVQAVGWRDYPVVQAVVLISASLFVTLNLIVDLLYRAIDPRMRHG
jgi:peptide/nickel transport system permease protein